MSDSSKKSFSLTKKDVDLMEWIRKAFRGERESPTEIKQLVPSLDVQRPGNVVSALMAQMGPGLWGGVVVCEWVFCLVVVVWVHVLVWGWFLF